MERNRNYDRNCGGCNLKISVGIIALNEEKYIENIMQDVLKQTYPQKNIELLLIDGGSTDHTKGIMQSFQKAYEDNFLRIIVLDNPRKIQAAGWNVAIKNYQGEALIRIDAHAHIPSDFIEKNVICLEKGEFVCGGRCPYISENKSLWSEILLEAENAMFGSGISNFRTGNKTSYVKSLCHGAYRREVFDKVGLFNEQLGRTEDNDMHQRIMEAGYKNFYDANILSYKYVRPTWKRVLVQKFSNGYWIGRTTSINPKCISTYYYVPAVFVFVLLASILFALLGNYVPLVFLGTIYGALQFVMAGISVIKKKNIAFMIIPVICFSVHIAYGIGTIKGLAKQK